MILILNKANQKTWGFPSCVATRIMIATKNDSTFQRPSLEQEKFLLVLYEKESSKRNIYKMLDYAKLNQFFYC